MERATKQLPYLVSRFSINWEGQVGHVRPATTELMLNADILSMFFQGKPLEAR